MNTPREPGREYQTNRDSDRARAHQVLVEKLGTYSRDLRNLEKVSPVVDAQRVSENLRAKQEWERKEIKERIAEEAHCLDDSKASYQNLVDDLQRSEIVTKGAEGMVASIRAAIVKAQALIRDKELKVANEKKRWRSLRLLKVWYNRNLMSILRD